MATLLERNGHCGTHNLVSTEDWFATSARNLATEQLIAAQLSPVLLTCTNRMDLCLHAIHVVSPDCPSKTSNGSKRVEVKKEPENADKLKKKSFKQAEVSVLYNGPTNTIQWPTTSPPARYWSSTVGCPKGISASSSKDRQEGMPEGL